jgi:hypothetical protein
MLEQPASAPHAATNSPNAPGIRIGVEDAIDDFNIRNPSLAASRPSVMKGRARRKIE